MTAVEYTLFEAYNKQQLCEIMKGMEQNVDVIQYADPRYSDWQMWKIREALNDGLDVTCLLDHRWDDEMTSVLQFALYDGMDLSSYADATVIIGLKQNPTHGRRFSPIFLLKSGILWGKTQNATTKRRKTEYGMG